MYMFEIMPKTLNNKVVFVPYSPLCSMNVKIDKIKKLISY